MVRTTTEHALSEILRPWDFLKQMFLRPEVILRETQISSDPAGYGVTSICVYEGKKETRPKLQI